MFFHIHNIFRLFESYIQFWYNIQKIIKNNDNNMQGQHTKMPMPIQYPSFGQSINASPLKISDSSPVQNINGHGIHRISIHLPQKYLDNDYAQQKHGDQRTSVDANKIGRSCANHGFCDQRHGNIRVYCRMRQSKQCEQSGIKYSNNVIEDGENSYNFDWIFDGETSQEEVYKKIAQRHIDDFFLGKNSTIFVYGQTGSGKTYTMFGNMNEKNTYGIIPRTLQELFKHDLKNCIINCSMLQIYNQKFMDLFNPLTHMHIQIKLKEFNNVIYLEGLQEISVSNQEELFNLIKFGHKYRKIAITMNNYMSSRSHTILFLYRDFVCNGQYFRTKLCFIDLAGSEKIRKSGVKGQNLQETKKINLSLSCLGNVIHSLTNGSEHIPYRNSKLTRILKDSLSTDTCTSIITTCSLNHNNYNETVSTIKFAVRAKKIRSKKKALQEQQPSLAQEFIKLKKQLQQTRRQLEHYKRKEIQEEEEQCTEADIPEETSNLIPPLRSICVTVHGNYGNAKFY